MSEHVALYRSELSQAITTPAQLAALGYIQPDEVGIFDRLKKRYRVFITPYYASLIDPKDPDCPIRKQAIPQVDELLSFGVPDPLGDLKNQPVTRITHRYEDRVLLHLTSTCSMLCRYCFRKSLLNEKSGDFVGGETQKALDYIATHPEIQEVIFSGGDPLMVSSDVLAETLQSLNQMPHLKRVRFHTRVPVTLPMRVDSELEHALSLSSLPVVVVTHFNHPKEVTSQSIESLRRLKGVSSALLNQSVLLKGVNDSSKVLAELSEALFQNGVLPYYLHHPDRAAGTSHFWIDFELGKKIYRELKGSLSGYLVPRYVVDTGDRLFKTPVMGI